MRIRVATAVVVACVVFAAPALASSPAVVPPDLAGDHAHSSATSSGEGKGMSPEVREALAGVTAPDVSHATSPAALRQAVVRAGWSLERARIQVSLPSKAECLSLATAGRAGVTAAVCGRYGATRTSATTAMLGGCSSQAYVAKSREVFGYAIASIPFYVLCSIESPIASCAGFAASAGTLPPGAFGLAPSALLYFCGAVTTPFVYKGNPDITLYVVGTTLGFPVIFVYDITAP